MMLPEIHFGARFTKLPRDCKCAVLVQYIVTRFEYLTREFKEYDGQYIDADGKVAYWEFPESGPCFILLFADGSRLFASTRKFNEENRLLYCNKVGCAFNLVRDY